MLSKHVVNLKLVLEKYTIADFCTFILYFEHPKKDRPGFLGVFDHLSEAGDPQLQIGLFLKVWYEIEDEETDDDTLSPSDNMFPINDAVCCC